MVVRRTTKYCLAATLCLGAVGAVAQENSLDSSITVFGALRTGGEFVAQDSDVVYDAKDSTSYGLIWNTRQKRNTEWEVYFSYQPTEVERRDPLLVTPAFDFAAGLFGSQLRSLFFCLKNIAFPRPIEPLKCPRGHNKQTLST